MRILLASAYDPLNQTQGQGVIIKHTLNAGMAGHPSEGIEIGLSLFRDGARRPKNEMVTHFTNIRKEQYQPAPSLNRLSLIRDLLNLPLTRSERDYVSRIADIAKKYDIVLWFGSPYDPVTHRIAHEIECPVLCHVNDSISLHEERREGRGAILRRVIAARVEGEMLRNAGFAAIVYVGAVDAEKAQTILQGAETITAVSRIPLGVDTDYFRPRAGRPAKRKTILFAGSMCYAPNIDAARRLVLEILPLVQCSPLVRIVGHSPPKEVQVLANRGDGTSIVVTGRVEDISEEYRNADLLVAPLERGAGMQFKVLDALASGVPVVTSPLVAGGIGPQVPGLFVCRSAAEYAAKIDQLLQSDQFRLDRGVAGRAHVERYYTWAKRTRSLLDLLGATIVRKRPRAIK